MAIKKNIPVNNGGLRGVTLTELAVSITIISLMIAGTFAGSSLVKGAKIRKIVSELTGYMSAINEFNTQYGYFPGDLPTASNYWNGAQNGDGDGFVEGITSDNGVSTDLEDLYAWEHLGRAKLIGPSYSGAVSGTRYAATINAPASEPFTAGVFSFNVYQALIYNTAGHALRLGAIVTGTNGLPTAGFILAKDAYSIDVKVDDGLAASGMFYATRDTTGCTDAASGNATALYVLSDVNATCRLFYWQKKF